MHIFDETLNYMRILTVGLILCLWGTTAFAATRYFFEADTVTTEKNYIYGDFTPAQLLAAAETTELPAAEPESGDLIIPGDEEAQNGQKQCLTVCKKWGEDCVINPRTGQRQCRKTCKDFGEECF